METVTIVFLILVGLITAIGFTYGLFVLARSVLDSWARENGDTLVECQRKDFFRGPFFFTVSKSQVAYRIVVQDSNGNRRSGYVRVGGFFLGPMSDQS